MQQLDKLGPNGKPWREDVLHSMGASLVRWHSEDAGPEVEPEIDISRYEGALSEMDRAWTPEKRAERDRLLTASDWTQLPDASVTDPQRKAWAKYRQALRDLPVAMASGAAWPKPPKG